MKTSVTLLSPDRYIGKYLVPQQTKDKYFNASSLLKQWNSTEGNPKREMKRYLDSPKTKELIDEIKRRETPIAEMRLADNEPVKIIKGRNTSRGRTEDRILMHPFLFIDFAMWISASFRYDVIKFVNDTLIENRIIACDLNINLKHSIKNNLGVNNEGVFIILNILLNEIAFGFHKKNIRNNGTSHQLNELNEIQKIYKHNIDRGIITTFNDLVKFLRLELYDKNPDGPQNGLIKKMFLELL